MTDINIEELKKRLREKAQRRDEQALCSPSPFFRDLEREAANALEQLQRELEEARRDAERYLRLVGSGDFVPSIFGGWALRTLTDKYATKAELDAAVDSDAARQQKG